MSAANILHFAGFLIVCAAAFAAGYYEQTRHAKAMGENVSPQEKGLSKNRTTLFSTKGFWCLMESAHAALMGFCLMLFLCILLGLTFGVFLLLCHILSLTAHQGVLL